MSAGSESKRRMIGAGACLRLTFRFILPFTVDSLRHHDSENFLLRVFLLFTIDTRAVRPQAKMRYLPFTVACFVPCWGRAAKFAPALCGHGDDDETSDFAVRSASGCFLKLMILGLVLAV